MIHYRYIVHTLLKFPLSVSTLQRKWLKGQVQVALLFGLDTIERKMEYTKLVTNRVYTAVRDSDSDCE